MVELEVKLTGIDNVISALKALPPEVVSKRGGPVKTALRKAAQVIRKEAIKNIHRVTSNKNAGITYENTMLLSKSIKLFRVKSPNFSGEKYQVIVGRKIYQNKFRNGKRKLATSDTGWFLEYGTSKQPAEPWIRPAARAKAQEAINTATRELVNEINKIKKKLGLK